MKEFKRAFDSKQYQEIINLKLKGELRSHESNRLRFDKIMMAFAIYAAGNSNDPRTKVGACIANFNIDNNVFWRVVGCNSVPPHFSTSHEGNWIDTKYPYVIHAEERAITDMLLDRYLSTQTYLSKGTIYTTLFPCNECAKQIAMIGIKEVVYLSDKYHDKPNTIAARRIFDSVNIKYRKLDMEEL